MAEENSSTLVAIGATEYSVADYTTPAERIFREAWSAPPEGSTVIGVDMAKAKDVWRDKIRLARKQKLLDLDAAYMKALESGDTSAQSTAATKKQALRDAPANSAIEAATTVDQLKATWDTDLLGAWDEDLLGPFS